MHTDQYQTAIERITHPVRRLLHTAPPEPPTADPFGPTDEAAPATP